MNPNVPVFNVSPAAARSKVKVPALKTAVRGGWTSAWPFCVAQLPGTPAVLVWNSLTVPLVTGEPPAVTVTTAEAAESCGTLAEGLKLSVVIVAGGASYPNAIEVASSIVAAGPAIVLNVSLMR
jgi:hypothetical protein